jgi:hypothetical protein
MHKPSLSKATNPENQVGHPSTSYRQTFALILATATATAIAAAIATTATPAHAEDNPEINILGAGVDLNNAAPKNDRCDKCPDTHRIAANISQHLATVDSSAGESKVPITSFGFRYDGQVVKDGKLKIYLGSEIGVAIADGDSGLTGGLNLAVVTPPVRLHLGVGVLYPPNADNFQFGGIEAGLSIFPTSSFGFGLELNHGTNQVRELASKSHNDAFCAENNEETFCQTDLDDQTALGAQIYIYPSDHFGLQLTGETAINENKYWQIYAGPIFSF